MILLLDNYDSFTYNLYQLFLKLNCNLKVVRSDKITVDEIIQMNPSHIVVSPGPGTPYEAGICIDTVKKLKGKYPIFGVCLGHQSILAAFDVPIVSASRIVHGKVDRINHNEKGIFRNIAQPTFATRYHSLAAKENDIPDCFTISAKAEDGEVMAVEHKDYCLVGVQFHPESIGTKDGEIMVKNFLNYRHDAVPIKKYLHHLIDKKNLSQSEAYDIMDELTEGNLSEAQIGSMLASLQMKGVTAEELAGFAGVLKKKALSFPACSPDEKRLDTCGTGGSKDSKTFNVSTIVSLLASAGGAKVVKHGNRAVTSKSGSADLFEKLGVNIDISNEKCFEIFNKIGLTFLFARKFHGAMRHAANARASVGYRTIFNLVGPLSNPGYATHQIIGVFDKDLTETMCQALNLLGIKRALVVHGLDGLDEISLTAPTKITELNEGWIRSYIFNPESIGLKLYDHSELAGGDVETNKSITLSVITGEDSPKADLAYLNAGAAFYVYGLSGSIREGYDLAREIARSKKALEKLEDLIRLSNE
jgi:anthranilate synthase/phosphoribosyltransferase